MKATFNVFVRKNINIFWLNVLIILIISSVLLSGCSDRSEIDSKTGMAVMFCRDFSDKFAKANDAIWGLAKFRNSVDEATEAVLQVASDARTIASVSIEPASTWLGNIEDNSADFLTYFSGQGGSSENLVGIYGEWNQNFSKLKEYCP